MAVGMAYGLSWARIGRFWGQARSRTYGIMEFTTAVRIAGDVDDSTGGGNFDIIGRFRPVWPHLRSSGVTLG